MGEVPDGELFLHDLCPCIVFFAGEWFVFPDFVDSRVGAVGESNIRHCGDRCVGDKFILVVEVFLLLC